MRDGRTDPKVKSAGAFCNKQISRDFCSACGEGEALSQSSGLTKKRRIKQTSNNKKRRRKKKSPPNPQNTKILLHSVGLHLVLSTIAVSFLGSDPLLWVSKPCRPLLGRTQTSWLRRPSHRRPVGSLRKTQSPINTLPRFLQAKNMPSSAREDCSKSRHNWQLATAPLGAPLLRRH